MDGNQPDFAVNKLFIVTPCHDGMYHANYVEGLEASTQSPHYCGSFRSELESDIGRHRSKMGSLIVTDPRFANSKHVLWVDADIGWSRAHFDRMASLPDDLHIVAGVYVKKDDSFEIVARGRGEETYPGIPDIVKRTGVGFGFVRTSMEVLKALYHARGVKTRHEWRPMIMGAFLETEDGVGYESEDYAFCIKAKQLGFDTWLDRSIRLTHRGFKSYRA